MQHQLEVRNYDKLQPVSQGYLCKDYLFATILSYAMLDVFTLVMAWPFPFR